MNVRTGEHIGIPPLTKKQVKPKNSSIADHLLFCSDSASYDNFSILTGENKKFFVELKENLLIMRDKPSLNRHHYIGTIVPTWQALVIRSLLEFYLLLIVATLFLLNRIFITLLCVSVWAPLLALMVLFDLLSSWSWDWTLPLSRVVIHLL